MTRQGVSGRVTENGSQEAGLWASGRTKPAYPEPGQDKAGIAGYRPGPSAFSTIGLTSPIISSIERIAAVCGVLPTLNEKHTCTGLVASISATSLSATVSTSPISRSL